MTRQLLWTHPRRLDSLLEFLWLQARHVARRRTSYVMPPVTDSTFTRIIRGEMPAHRVWEDEEFVAFLDINPVQRGHVLLIPRQQVDSIYDLDEKTYAALWQRVRLLAPPICANVKAKRNRHRGGGPLRPTRPCTSSPGIPVK